MELNHYMLLAIKDLSLAARQTIDGFMTGINKSKVKGTGLEFSQYRSYQPGDDLRWLDWKRYARSDRFYIRESEIETGINIRILVDASRSMEHRDRSMTAGHGGSGQDASANAARGTTAGRGGTAGRDGLGDGIDGGGVSGRGPGVSKIEYARLLAASIGWLANRQGDALGLYVFQDGGLFALPARKDPQHMARFFHQLESIQPGGQMQHPLSYRQVFLGESKKELLIFITDYYERDNEITAMLELLASLGHEIIVFHLIAGNELSKDFGSYTQLEDLETGQRVPVSDRFDEDYLQRMDQWLASVRSRLLDNHITWQLLRLDQPMDQALRNFLKQRQQITG